MKYLCRILAPLAPPLACLCLLVTMTSVTHADPLIDNALADGNLVDGNLGDSSLGDNSLGLPAASSPGNSMIDSDSINHAPPPTPKITPAQAADLVRRSTGGQVMNVNTEQTEAGLIYGVKVLNSGRMRVIRVDSQTGKILGN